MVIMLLAALAGSAGAQALTVGPTLGVVGRGDVGLRPGLRVGYEPSEAAVLELAGDAGFDGRWDAGLSLAGHLWFAGDGSEGIYGLGRFTAGLSGDAGDFGPWTGLFVGFGGRPVPFLDVGVSVGPEWALTEGPRWRSDLAVSLIFGDGTFGGGPGRGKVRHHPRKL